MNLAGQKLERQAEATAAAPCGEGRPKAARQYVVSACIFSFCPAMFIQLLAQTMYFQLLPSHVFSAFAQPGVPNQRAAGAFFPEKRTSLDF